MGRREIESPYLWDKKTRRGARPVKDQLGIQHGGQSLGVERASADFGAEESFGQAAKRFEEHYGWPIDRARVGREVEKTALKAERYVANRLVKAAPDSSQPLKLQPETEQVVVELDGCHQKPAGYCDLAVRQVVEECGVKTKRPQGELPRSGNNIEDS